MNNLTPNTIPANITYICREIKNKSCGNHWDTNWHWLNFLDSIHASESVAVDATDKEGLKKAKIWGERSYWDYVKGKNILNKYTIKIVKNEPISKLQIIDKTIDENQILHYLVLIDDLYVQLDNDSLLDILLHNEIKCGVINGQFIWAKIGHSNLKLISIDSNLYKAIAYSDSKKGTRSINKSKLEVGGVYQDRRQEKHIFIGNINTTKYNRLYANQKHSFEKIEVTNSMLFQEVKGKKYEFNLLDNDFIITTTHKNIEKIAQIDIPKEAISDIKKLFIKEVKEEIVSQKDNPYGYNLRISELSEFINMYEVNSEPVELFDVNKYLIFI